ncbi:alpha/beta hydrolase [Mariniflexile ostreae]|uniref:Alpha/beta hydrolase n=1 Tax=Mariniflexile ostreae TaxID=1520892 RepID=A0ABV5F7I6_9FLAO
MKKNILSLLFLCLFLNTVKAQVIYKPIESLKMGEIRELKIQLPRGYNDNPNKKYPLFVVFDGDYMFEAVAGNVDYYSYWEDMPNAIVVGVNQLDKRFEDSMYSEQNGLPTETGARFFEFIGMELIPFMEKNYRTAYFKVAVGHGETANFINYFLLKDQPVFQAYVVISPELAPKTIDYVPERLSTLASKSFYYLATTKKDSKEILDDAEKLHGRMSGVDNKNLVYKYDAFNEPSHYSLPAHVMPRALESIFNVYQPISVSEYRDVILKLEGSPVVYLEEKYKMIYDLFGIEKDILVNDFKAIAAAIEKTEQFEYYEQLGKMGRKSYPNTILGNYYIGRFYEQTGNPKKAMRTYQSAFILSEIGGITKDELMNRANAIKTDFGY